MAKDKSEKKDKREKKEKRSEKDGVHKSKKDKKEKKDKTVLAEAVEQELTSKVLDGIDKAVAAESAVNGTAEAEMDVDGRPVGALVPFANPLVEDKQAKKVLKSVKKGE
jgi:H/ACA ribonucleoprotein complex subunit 2